MKNLKRCGTAIFLCLVPLHQQFKDCQHPNLRRCIHTHQANACTLSILSLLTAEYSWACMNISVLLGQPVLPDGEGVAPGKWIRRSGGLHDSLFRDGPNDFCDQLELSMHAKRLLHEKRMKSTHANLSNINQINQQMLFDAIWIFESPLRSGSWAWWLMLLPRRRWGAEFLSHVKPASGWSVLYILYIIRS